MTAARWSPGAAGPLLAGIPGGWQDDALCAREGSPEDFFPEKGHADTGAMGICRRCPVIAACRSYILSAEAGMGRETRHGVWAAMSPEQRWDADRAARRAAA